jgi:hypothetical protein
MAALPSDDRALIGVLAEERWSASRVAARIGKTAPEVSEALVRIVRDLGELYPVGPHDELIGAYLLSQRTVADREQFARSLYETGIDPLELDRVEETFGELQRAGRRRRYGPPAAAGMAMDDL